MSIRHSAGILRHRGLTGAGPSHHRVKLAECRNNSIKLQVLLVHVGGHALARGSKHYFVRSVGESGETSARSVASVHEYLQDHFEQLRISFAYFRDISGRLAQRHIEQKAQARGTAPMV